MVPKFNLNFKKFSFNRKSLKNEEEEEDPWPFKKTECETEEGAGKEHPNLESYLNN